MDVRNIGAGENPQGLFDFCCGCICVSKCFLNQSDFDISSYPPDVLERLSKIKNIGELADVVKGLERK